MDEYLKTLLEQIRCKKARPYGIVVLHRRQRSPGRSLVQRELSVIK